MEKKKYKPYEWFYLLFIIGSAVLLVSGFHMAANVFLLMGVLIYLNQIYKKLDGRM